ncbi:uncharacterized protein LODBEIA_P20390 [Lodderomyces beijingensis]|uniref:Monopolin complex subunit Csm1/Pcs1 C-terminal domain-containing protein n=1 Tax=Lodderomyces beijingensis TaxID=1775926 RepID=A0ABP0ZNH6_9ASCO
MAPKRTRTKSSKDLKVEVNDKKTRKTSSSNSSTTTNSASTSTSTSSSRPSPNSKRKATPIFTEDLISSTDISSLVDLINENIHTSSDVNHAKYKELAEEQMSKDHELIQQLREENESLRESISKPQAEYTSPIRNMKIKQDDFEKEREHICFTLDLLELLTGIKVTNFEETATQFTFDVKQTSANKSTAIEYQLVVSKIESSRINYIPVFMDDEEESEAKKTLIKVLPEYLCECLSFPFNSLAQFYTKVNKAINQKP